MADEKTTVKVKTIRKHRFNGEVYDKGKTYEVSLEEASELETLEFVQMVQDKPKDTDNTPSPPAPDQDSKTDKK